MKKKYLYIAGAKHWNNLLGKFTKLQKRLQLLSNNSDSTRYKKLVNKLQNIFSKLEKMQYQTGIKVAGTSLALVLSAFTANAQFAAGELLQGNLTINVSYSSNPVFADIDGDGDLDLYIGGADGKINVFTNNNGLFTATANLQAGGTDIVGDNSSPVFADIDGDSDLDLYIGGVFGEIKVFTNNSGVFTAAPDLQAGGTTIDADSYSKPTFADIDGDGDLDLYVGNNYGVIKVFTNNSGVFTAAPDLQAGGTIIDVGSHAKPAFEDIDGDGDLDLYVGEYSGSIKVFTNNSGVFTAAPDLQAGGITIDVSYRSSPTFADIDGDGDLDLYVGEYYGTVKVFTNNSGVLTAAPDLQAGGTNIDVGISSSLTFEDIDTDGDLDIYVGEKYGRINIFTNNNAVFSKEPLFQVGGGALDVGLRSHPAFADIDGDGDLDLYVGGGTGEIKVFTNNSGVFTAATDLQADGSTIDVGADSKPTFADIDGDGDLDLYVGEFFGRIYVFTNNNGVFTAAPDLQAGGTNIDIGDRSTPIFADIDGDGDLDLYVGDLYGAIKVFTNNSGVFTAAPDLQAGGTDINVGYWNAPTFADVDGDGDLDLYVGNSDGHITLYENTSAAAILVSSITVQGQGGVSTIATPAGTLQIEAAILPVNASNSTYTWSLVNGTGSASIDANGLLTATTDGTVTVTATANDASGETAGMIVTISNQSVGIDAATANAINIYPNPVQNELFIEMAEGQITEINILDLSGKIVRSIIDNTKTIDVSDLTQGIYFLKIRTENDASATQFIKQ